MRTSVRGKEEGSNQRQHIRLSRFADEIIHQDMDVWEIGKMTTMINQIFANFKEDSLAAVTWSVQGYRNHLIEMLTEGKESEKEDSKGKKSEERESEKSRTESALNEEKQGTEQNLTRGESRTIDRIARSYQEDLIRANNSYPKDVTYKIRINNENYEYLYGNGGSALWADAEYYRSPGAFIKAMLEDYARRTGPEREKIYFKEFYKLIDDELNLSPEKRSVLRIKYRTGSGKTFFFDVKPYQLSTDSESLYNYLVGYSKPVDGQRKDYHPAVFRLSRILDVKRHGRSFGSAKITHDEKEEIDSLIETRGIQFLIRENEHIILRLTPAGMNQYNTLLHLRPMDEKDQRTTDESENVTMHFNCPPTRIGYYFFKFGSNVEILSPKSLRDSFEKQYREAVEVYQGQE